MLLFQSLSPSSLSVFSSSSQYNGRKRLQRIHHRISDRFFQFFIVISLLALQNFVLTVKGHREHKVHNIVLYPDKHSWCKTLQIKQVISYPGCISQEIDNNVCVGACFSYSIPHTEPSDPGEMIVPYCDSCQPSDTTWKHITLDCSVGKNGTAARTAATPITMADIHHNDDEKQHDKNKLHYNIDDGMNLPEQLIKRVQIINNCSCSLCEKGGYKTSASNSNNHISAHNSDSALLDDVFDDLLNSQNNVPDLLNFLNDRKRDTDEDATDDAYEDDEYDDTINTNKKPKLSSEYIQSIRSLMNHKILNLLKNIQEHNSQHDREQLIELLRIVQGPNPKHSDKNIAEFVDSLHSENIALDVPKLREILQKIDQSKSKLLQRKDDVDGGNLIGSEPRIHDEDDDTHVHLNEHNRNEEDDDEHEDNLQYLNHYHNLEKSFNSKQQQQQQKQQHRFYFQEDSSPSSNPISSSEDDKNEKQHSHHPNYVHDENSKESLENYHQEHHNSNEKSLLEDPHKEIPYQHHPHPHYHHHHHHHHHDKQHYHYEHYKHLHRNHNHHHHHHHHHHNHQHHHQNHQQEQLLEKDAQKKNEEEVEHQKLFEHIAHEHPENDENFNEQQNSQIHHNHQHDGEALIIEEESDESNENPMRHEQLDVNPHELKPNHAGTLLSYSSHASSSASTLTNHFPPTTTNQDKKSED